MNTINDEIDLLTRAINRLDALIQNDSVTKTILKKLQTHLDSLDNKFSSLDIRENEQLFARMYELQALICFADGNINKAQEYINDATNLISKPMFISHVVNYEDDQQPLREEGAKSEKVLNMEKTLKTAGSSLRIFGWFVMFIMPVYAFSLLNTGSINTFAGISILILGTFWACGMIYLGKYITLIYVRKIRIALWLSIVLTLPTATGIIGIVVLIQLIIALIKIKGLTKSSYFKHNLLIKYKIQVSLTEWILTICITIVIFSVTAYALTKYSETIQSTSAAISIIQPTL